jgi:hypothetical protein|nr:hypothetical protein [Prosthecobacter sp.]
MDAACSHPSPASTEFQSGHDARDVTAHHPVDDAKGNAEALLTMKEQMGLKIRL